MSRSDNMHVEVERRKQRAWQLGLPVMVTDFYRQLARFYPIWKDNQPTLLPQSLSDIRQVGQDAIEFTCQDDRYVFTWNERTIDLPNGDVRFSSTIEVLVNGSRVFEVYLRGDFNEYTGTDWRPSDVSAFLEGPWVRALQDLAAEGARLYTLEQERAQARTREQETEELRARFGIAANQPSEVGHRPGLRTWVRRILGRLAKRTDA